MHESLWWVICTYFYELIPDTILVQNCSKKYRCLKKLLRLLFGGVGWGFGLMHARQGDRDESAHCALHSSKENLSTWFKCFEVTPGIAGNPPGEISLPNVYIIVIRIVFTLPYYVVVEDFKRVIWTTSKGFNTQCFIHPEAFSPLLVAIWEMIYAEKKL